MQMTFRWFGKEKDTVTLEQIKQIPNVVGVVPALHDLPAGEAWTMDRVQAMYDEITAAGLTMECIESVNVHEDIKIGLPTRDKYIANYKTSIRNLAKVGVKVICYNFMPVFDWTRTDLYMPLEDGSTCLCYDGKQVEGKSPEDMFKEIDDNSNGYAMPGWETERMGEIKELFEKYKGVTADDLWDNLKYFLEAIMPVCEECDVKMAIHPDDPPWGIFGLPRIITGKEALQKLFKRLSVLNNSRKSENIPWRIVGMDSHFDITLLTHGHNRIKEIFEIVPKVIRGNTLILFKKLLYFGHSLGFPAGHCIAV